MKRLYLLSYLVFAYLFTFSQTVYISESGKKFHKKNCSVANTGKSGIALGEAQKRGYQACKVCKPDEAVEEKKKTPKSKR
jgi:methylphosphotriester-DNA--protein-cysteine methyltransferase